MAPPQFFIKASLPTFLPHFSLSLSLPLSLPPSLPLSLPQHSLNSQSIDEAFLMSSSMNLLGEEPSIWGLSKVGSVHGGGNIAPRSFLPLSLGCGESHGWVLSPTRWRAGGSAGQKVTAVDGQVVPFGTAGGTFTRTHPTSLCQSRMVVYERDGGEGEREGKREGGQGERERRRERRRGKEGGREGGRGREREKRKDSEYMIQSL